MTARNVALSLKSQKTLMFVQQWLSTVRIVIIAIRRNLFMEMLFSTKCTNCGNFLNKCTCVHQTTAKEEQFSKARESKSLGRIIPIKAFQTTDGRKFVGEGAREKAEDHQRWLDIHRTQPKERPPREPLKKLKRKRRKPL
jgi:hypothetical protein